MINVGKYNKLVVNRMVDFGVYLSEKLGEKTEVLLPARYVTEPLNVGDEVEVFVYTDSDDRPVAVTDAPLATVGEFAYLECVSVTKVGAFLDWGLPKDLLCPFSEQKIKMRTGMVYLVYVYLDHDTGRVAASAKIEKYIGNAYPELREGEQVEALVYKRTPLGYGCIVNNLYAGMIYENEIFRAVEIGETVKAMVHRVRSDGKIDLTLGGNARNRSVDVSERIMEVLKAGERVCEKSTPEAIESRFGCSKKDFKKGIGFLLKNGKIFINRENGEVSLLK